MKRPTDNAALATAAKLLRGGNFFQARMRLFALMRIAIHLLIVVTAVAESFQVLHTPAAGILIFLFAVGSIVTLTLAQCAQVTSRLFRINLLLTDSLGLDQTDLDNQALISHHGISSECDAQAVSNYNQSSLKPGTPRLRSNLAETLFFAQHLWKHSAGRLRIIIIIPSILFLCIALFAPFLQKPFLVSLDRIVIFFVAFLSEVHLVSEYVKLLSSSEKCQFLYTRLLHADTEQNVDLVHICCAYAALAFSTPPPMQIAYQRLSTELNAIWDVERRKFE